MGNSQLSEPRCQPFFQSYYKLQMVIAAGFRQLQNSFFNLISTTYFIICQQRKKHIVGGHSIELSSIEGQMNAITYQLNF